MAGYNRSICYSNDLSLYVLVAKQGVIQTSITASNWVFRKADNEYEGIFNTCCYGNDQFIIAGTGGEIQTSPDGITWTHRAGEGGGPPG